MRPVTLCIEGFTCFRTRQEIAFGDLQLFAVSGPTGAGKSSVLDAMMFALFGRVPRVGKEHRDLIHMGGTRASVQFTFRVQQAVWRVTRESRRKGTGTVLLERLEGAEFVRVMDGARDVEQEVEKILGLGFEAFVQAVMLPQGQFAQFLQAEPARRREILMRLLRLDLYERMRAAAHEAAQGLEARRSAAERRLAADFSDVNAAAWKAAEAHGAALAQRRSETSAALERATADAQRTRQHAELTRRLADAQHALETLDRSAPALAEAARRLDADERLLPVREPLAAWVAARDRAQAAQAKHQQRVATEEARRESGSRAESRVAQTTAALDAMRGTSDRLRELEGARAWWEARERVRTKQRAVETESARLRKDIQRAAGGLQGRVDKHQREKDAAARALQKAQSMAVDGARLARLEDLSQDANAAAQWATEVESLRARVTQDANGLVALEDALKSATTAHTRETSALEQARNQRDRVLLEQGKATAALLRHSLVKGEPCPVCDQPVAALPKGNRGPKVEDAAVRDAEKALHGAEQTERDAAAAHVRAQERAESARARAAETEDELARLEGRLQQAREDLHAAAEVPVDRAEAALLEDLRNLRVAARAAAEALDAARALEATATEGARQLQEAQRAQKQLEEALSRQAADAAALATETAELDARLAGIPEDAASEMARLGALLNAAQQAHALAQQDLAAARALLDDATRTTAASAQAMETLRTTERDARSTLERAARDAGLAAVDGLDRDALTPAERARLQAELGGHREERAQRAQQVERLMAELGIARVTAVQLQAAEQAVNALRVEAEATITASGAAEEALRQLNARLTERRRLEEELATTSETARVQRRLADDLRSDRFQAFLLEQAFQELVAGASTRLMALTGRYTLVSDGKTFHVEDHEHARERRRAETLSGGETFLASLALALELSAQVQRASGAVALESLFIDEGFGTLDPQALEVVAQALEGLPAGGRMVGVISHIPELTARMPARIHVDKHAEGSLLRVEA